MSLTIKQLANQQEIEYKWLDFFEPSIRSYFDKMEKCLTNKEPYYPLFIQELDSITLKFEGLLRDLIEFSKIEGFSTLKFCSDSNNRKVVQKKNINQFLWDKKIFEILPVNDVWFLRYLLIEQVNLRNDIAHSLMLTPKQYHLHLFHNVLIALLRLSKFRITNTEQTI